VLLVILSLENQVNQVVTSALVGEITVLSKFIVEKLGKLTILLILYSICHAIEINLHVLIFIKFDKKLFIT
jgi:hypothetical protein